MGSKIYPKGFSVNDVSYHSTPKAQYANWGWKNHGTSAYIPARQQKTLEMQCIGSQAWNLRLIEQNCNTTINGRRDQAGTPSTDGKINAFLLPKAICVGDNICAWCQLIFPY